MVKLIPLKRCPLERLLLISGLIVLLSLIAPVTASAAPPVPAGAEKCVECHEAETDAWQNSPHARAGDDAEGALGATCEACHGLYVEDHPQTGVMQLRVDSSACEDCHTGTVGQWQNSIHAEAGVQCIGCHQSHSQEFRLSDDELCASCHRDRLATTHGQADVSCIECHLSSTDSHEIVPVSAGASSQAIPVASHDFTSVLSKDCVSCHGQDVHTDEAIAVSSVRLPDTPECEPELTAKLKTAEQTNRSLLTMTPVSLGLGLGIGGMLGIIFMLVVGYINQGTAKK